MIKRLLLCALACMLIGAPVFSQSTTLLNFAGFSNGSAPKGSLISVGSFLYGMTTNGGLEDAGTIFRIMPDGSSYTKLLDFSAETTGKNPWGDLYFDGIFLYGMTNTGGENGGGTLFKILPDGSSFSTILDFAGTTTGSNPGGSLISDGTFLYGMTDYGGLNNEGTIFKILPDGTGYVKLLDFDEDVTGSYPFGSLLSDGTSLYGMTSYGGASYFGTLFKIMPDGSGYTRLLDFTGADNGRSPYGSLVTDGTYLYGMTVLGGENGLGVIFKILPNGNGYTTLLNFAGETNGSYGIGSLIYDGTLLYGMTQQGGANNVGTVFKIMPDGSAYTKLLDFNVSDGSSPDGSLLLDGGMLYGMTLNGGTSTSGVVFRLGLTLGIGVVSNGQYDLSIYPNPTSGSFTIDFPSLSVNAQVEIFNITGQRIYSDILTHAPQQLSTSQFAPGVYVVKVSDRQRSFTQKLVVQ